MTRDEKLAVIAGSLREAVQNGERAKCLSEGALFELAALAKDCTDSQSALELARLVFPSNERMLLADFCRLYYKYRSGEDMLSGPQMAEPMASVIIPEIARLDEALARLSENGIILTREYGDTFAACAEDVEYGHSRYVLMPMRDPVEGKLRSFDRLRDKHGLKIHCVIHVPADGSGDYAYQLCALGFPDSEVIHHARLSFTSYVKCPPVEYLRGTEVFGAKVLSAEIWSTSSVQISAVLDIEGIENNGVSGLLMYLSAGADLTIDGCYAEI